MQLYELSKIILCNMLEYLIMAREMHSLPVVGSKIDLSFNFHFWIYSFKLKRYSHFIIINTSFIVAEYHENVPTPTLCMDIRLFVWLLDLSLYISIPCLPLPGYQFAALTFDKALTYTDSFFPNGDPPVVLPVGCFGLACCWRCPLMALMYFVALV